MVRAPAGPPSVVVTGASTGIGRACALMMARRGWRVYAGVRSDAAASDLSAAASAAGAALTTVRLDVTDHVDIERAAELVAGEVAE